MDQTLQQTPREVDAIQNMLAEYACGLEFEHLSSQAIYAAKVRIVDTLGVLIGGYFGEPCRIARSLAYACNDANSATLIGSRVRSSVDMAAYVNTIASRQAEMNDIYHKPGSRIGHPSDVIMAIYAAAEQAQVSGRELLVGVVLGYEVYHSMADIFHNQGFDHSNLGCIAAAVAVSRIWRLTAEQTQHCIAMAAVPSNILRQVRDGQLTMWKVVAAGHAARAAVFAAMLARAGMEGPHLPFIGKAGWCDHVARQRGELGTLGGGDAEFRICESRIKHRPASGATMASILAAEKIAPLSAANIAVVERINVEVFQLAKDWGASDAQHWNPTGREMADHSIPYLTACTLVFGTVDHRCFDDAHLHDPRVRALMSKVEVTVNDEYTHLYRNLPVRHCMRTTVAMQGARTLIGETGGGSDDLDSERSDEEIIAKFRVFTEDGLGATRMNNALDTLWTLETVPDVAVIAQQFVLI